jgi:uncharacterized protein YbgA (DUF1722 family)/uncharacterized protein YbbK (DUF523 family)
MQTATIPIGISACLLGEPVRYDGGHKHDRFLTDTLGQYVTYVPVCPEKECGLGIPREAMRLIGDPQAPRLVTVRSGVDHTARMQQWARRRLEELAREELCGFIFKSGSPSSGMERVKVYNEAGMAQKTGSGIFARAFMERFPLIPVEEEGRLNDPVLRENFISRIFTLKRWRDLGRRGRSLGGVVAFHTEHKLQILSHSPEIYRHMGRLVADGKTMPPAELAARYESLLMRALTLRATASKHTNVLQHMLGYFKRQLGAEEKQELLEVIEQYRHGLVPLIVPVTLINHFVRKYRQAYLAGQIYLHPHPLALKLRNHA